MGILHNSFSNCFFFTSNTFPSAMEKAAAEGQKTSEKFTAMLCFLQSLSTAKANCKSILTVFFSLSSWLTYTVLLFPNCHLSSNCFQFLRSCRGDPAHQVCPPASDSHVHMDWEEDLIPPSPPPPFLFFSLKIFPVLELFYFSRKQRTKPPTQGALLLYQGFSIVAILPHFRPWPASWFSCCSRPLPSPGQRVSKTSPEIEQTTLGDTATHRGTN